MTVPEAPSRGRPRDARRDEALRAATLAVLAEVGYRALTMDSVAKRANASKATIYRRWDTKLDLVIDSCTDSKAGTITPSSTTLAAGQCASYSKTYTSSTIDNSDTVTCNGHGATTNNPTGPVSASAISRSACPGAASGALTRRTAATAPRTPSRRIRSRSCGSSRVRDWDGF